MARYSLRGPSSSTAITGSSRHPSQTSRGQAQRFLLKLSPPLSYYSADISRQLVTSIPTSTTSPGSTETTFKKLTSAAIALRRKKGLCYNCNERSGPNHKCRVKFFLLIASEDDDPIISPPTLLQLDTPSSAQLSPHAFLSHTAFATLRVTGSMNGHDVIVLIDGGSTYNFVQDRMVHFLNLAAQPSQRLIVMVVNGSENGCSTPFRSRVTNFT